MAIKQEKMTLEKLAMMINNGFENAKIENQKQHEEIKKELKEEFKKNLNQFKKENSREHEEIKMRLDNVAYRFELTALQGRVQFLENNMVLKK